MKRYDLQWTNRCGVTFEELTESDDGEWMRFEDHEEIIRRQARAALSGMDAAKAISSRQLDLAQKARAESSPVALESERAANAKLTEEVAARDQALKDLGYQLGEAEQELAKAREERASAIDRLLPLGLENERLRKDLSGRLQDLDEIRNQSLSWAMLCDCDCPACNGLYEAIRGEAK